MEASTQEIRAEIVSRGVRDGRSLGDITTFAMCIVGRCENAHLFLNHESVSRHHCAILRRGHELLVVDLGSGTGTRVNGELVKNARPITRQDTIAIGADTTIRVDWPPSNVPPDPSTENSRPPLPSRKKAGDVEFALSKQVMVIGRDPSCDVPLEEKLMISRRHAALEFEAGRWKVRDLNSSNGTFVNGVRVSGAYQLSTEDVLTVGDLNLRFTGNKLTTRRGGQGCQIDVQGLCIPGDKGKMVVEGATFSIEPGELVGVLGLSGSGKTRLMHGMSGRAPVTSGSILYDRLDFSSHADLLQASIGYVPSWLTLHESLTVGEGLRYASLLRLARDVTPEEVNANIDRVLRLLKIAHRRDLLISKLSDGERRRVGLAAELLGSAPILFLDEVTTALDVPTHIGFMRQFRELADTGKSLLLISHHLNDLDLCDKWLYLIRGRIAFFGTPEEFRAYFGVATLEEQLARDQELAEKEGGPGQPAEETHSRMMAARFEIYRGIRGELTQTGGATGPRPVAAPGSQPGWRGFFRQSRLLTARYVALLKSDMTNLATMLGLAPVISFMILLLNSALSAHVTSAEDDLTAQKGTILERTARVDLLSAALEQRAILIFMLVMSVIIVGTFMSVREVVKERVGKRSMFLHERFIGLSPLAYLLSKIVPLGVLSALSSIFVCGVVWLFIGRDTLGIDFPILLGAVLLTGWASVLLGLLISCIADSSEKAFYMLAPILILQLCLGGGLVKVDGTSVEKVSQAAVLAYWPYSALAQEVEPYTRDREIVPLKDESAEPRLPMTGQDLKDEDRRLEGKPWRQSLLALVSQAFLLTLTSLWVLCRRPDPSNPR